MKKYIELDVVHDAVSKLKRLAWQSSTTSPNAESCVAVELDAVHAAVENIPSADVVEKETVKKAFAGACQECRDSCEEFDGFYADCNQCLLHGVKEKLKAVLEVAEQ